MTLTQKLAHFALEINYDNIQSETIEMAKKTFIDAIACIISGSGCHEIGMAIDYCLLYGGVPRSTIIGSGGKRTDPCNCAMINGMSAHIKDFDDISEEMRGHPSVAVLPTALALGELCNSSGKEVLLSYIAGVEVCSLLGRGLYPGHCNPGWNTTSAVGVFGAVVAAAKLLKLNEEQLTNAFAIAASEASGLKGNFGTSAKDLTAGRTGSKAIFSAEMAKRGFIGKTDIMECKSGFAQTATINMNIHAIEKAIKDRKSTFIDPGITIKPYPSCRANHGGIDAAFEFLKEDHLDFNEVEQIICRVAPSVMENERYENPKTANEAKFSLPYCISLVLYKGNISISDFEDTLIDDKDFISLMQKVTLILDEKLVDSIPESATMFTQVEVLLKDGKKLTRFILYPKGDPNNPMTEKDMKIKFIDCTKNRIRSEKIRYIRDAIYSIDKITYISDLIQEIEKAFL